MTRLTDVQAVASSSRFDSFGDWHAFTEITVIGAVRRTVRHLDRVIGLKARTLL